ncbi:MAG TPA: alanine--glyoxylate aminotransferase family protein, partial [Candidatus Omnitrophota bacterium]|nr:alanine--glyoxylate aminotransferase family protein [Candidatus Omnitrophota bacterium]
LGETMNRVIEQVKAMARYVFQTQSGRILGVAGPASAAMEMAVANLVEPGTRVLSVCNGFFSQRLAEMSTRCGADVEVLDVGDAQTAIPENIEAAIKRFKPAILTIVQGETSNTVWNRHLPEICTICRAHDVLIVVDAVCTLSTMPIEMDAWGVDAVITGGQKGLSSIPGVSLLAFSELAWKRIEGRNAGMAQWCLDARLADRFWNKNSYHYTAPVSGIMAIHEALRLICNETLPARFHRHEMCSEALQAGIEAMGLELHVPKVARLNSVVGINIPEGISGDDVRRHMSQVYRVEISGAFGLNILRIGQMGEQCRGHYIFRTLHAFGSSLLANGGKIDLPAGVAALERVLTGANVS